MSAEDLHLDAAELTTARRQLLAGSIVSFFGNIGGAILTTIVYGPGLGNWLRYAHAGLSAVVCLVTLLAHPTRRLYIGLFTALVAPVLPLLVVWTLAIPEAKLSESFVAVKMVMMGVALLTPLSLSLGLLLLLALSLETLALWAFDLAGHLPGEPWVTLFYAVFAVALVVLRDADRRLSRRLTQVNAEAAALDRIARSSLEVRDRMNTPLQTLALSIDLLDNHVVEPAVRDTLARARRALVRLTELSQKLAEEDPNLRRR